MEREKQESQQTDFWSFIYCERDKKQLWLVPKEKRKQARNFIYGFEQKENEKKFIDKQSNKILENQPYLCCFESLTMRALHKLCFAEQSSFIEDMNYENLQEKLLLELLRDAKQYKTNNDIDKIKAKNQKKLKFLKEVLKSKYAKERLKLNNFNLQNIDNFEKKVISSSSKEKMSIDSVTNLEEFEKCLEKACYYIKKIIFTEQEKQDFFKQF